MKVPVYEQQVGPQSVALPAANVRPVSDAGIRQGLAQLDRGIAEVGAAEQRRAREAEQKAIAAEVTDSETRFTKAVTAEVHGDSAAGKQGFMSLQGRAAEADGAPVMERIEKARKDIADSLKNEEAKQLFVQRTGKQVEGVRSSVETYVSHQRRAADVASLNARATAAEEAIFNAARVGDGATVMNQSLALEGPIRALSLSPEDAERDVAMWQRKTAALQLDAYLDVDRLDVAEAMLNDEAVKGRLGPELAKKYTAAVEKAKGVGEAQSAAFRVVNGALDEIGQVNQTKVLDDLGKLPPDLRSKVEPIAYKLMAEREQAFAKETERISRSAYTMYNSKGWAEFERSGLSTELNFRNPELYNRLRDDSRQQADYWKRVKSGSKQDQQRQREINSFAMNQFLGLPIEEQASVDLGEFLVDRGTGSVTGSGVNPVQAQLEKAQRAARDQVEKGLGVTRESFVAGLKASLQKFAPPPGNTKESRGRAAMWWADHVADGVNAYNLWLDNNPTKKPTAEDIATIRATVIGELPPVPGNAESIAESARAMSIRGGGTGGPRAAEVSAIPAADRKQIEAALRAKGRVITEDAVQTLYRQVRGGR